MNHQLTPIVLNILKANTPGMTFAVKYFVIRVLIVYGEKKPVTEKMSHLVTNLGMTEKDIKKARDWLVKKSILISLRQKPEGKKFSRPIEGFKFDEVWLDMKGDGEPEEGYQLEILERVCELFDFGSLGRGHVQRYEQGSMSIERGREQVAENGENEISDKKQAKSRFGAQGSHKLRASNRILLAVLLLHSSEFGVVEGLGFGRLGQMAGMPVDRVKSQIKTLMQKGYIRRNVPGGTSSLVYGHFSGVYFLDLNQKDYIASNLPYTYVVLATGTWTKIDQRIESVQLYRASKDFGLKSTPGIRQVMSTVLSHEEEIRIDERYDEVISLFSELGCINRTQLLIEKTCVYLLNTFYEEINEVTESKVKELIDEIADDLLPIDVKSLKDKTGISNETLDKYRLASELLFEISLKKAQGLKTVTKKYCHELPFTLMKWQLLPFSPEEPKQNGRQYLVIALLPKEALHLDIGFVFVSQATEAEKTLFDDSETAENEPVPKSRMMLSNCKEPAFVTCVPRHLSHWISDETFYRYGMLTRLKESNKNSE